MLCSYEPKSLFVPYEKEKQGKSKKDENEYKVENIHEAKNKISM